MGNGYETINGTSPSGIETEFSKSKIKQEWRIVTFMNGFEDIVDFSIDD